MRPPKLAPSAWQLYFTDWIQRHQASSTRKLNVAQAAKEAGVEYARLSPEEKEVSYCACDLTSQLTHDRLAIQATIPRYEGDQGA